jgi:hypothetical protein
LTPHAVSSPTTPQTAAIAIKRDDVGPPPDRIAERSPPQNGHFD